MKIHQKVTSMKKNHGKLTEKLTKSADDGAVKGALIGSVAGSAVAGDRIRQGIKAVRKGDVARGGVTAGSKLMSLAKKSLKRSAPGVLAATAAGAGLGALTKSASVPAIRPRQVAGKLVKEPLSGKAKLALLAGGALATSLAAKKIGEKTGREHTPVSSTAGGAAKGALVGGAIAGSHVAGRVIGAGRMVRGLGITPSDKALRTMAERGLKMTGKGLKAGAAVGGLVGLAKGIIGHKKEAAEAVIHEGQTYRKGTIGSAATKMGLAGAVLGGLGGGKALGSIGMAGGALKTGLKAGLVGGAYGVVRNAFREERGDKSLTGVDFSEMKTKALQKKAAEKITKGGKTYRKGTVGSAAATMTGVNTGLAAAGLPLSVKLMKGLGASKKQVIHHVASNLGKAAVGGAVIGGTYGLVRGALREGRGEESLGHKEFHKMKRS